MISVRHRVRTLRASALVRKWPRFRLRASATTCIAFAREPSSIPAGTSFQNQLDAKLGDGAKATVATMANEAIVPFQFFILSTHITISVLTHQTPNQCPIDSWLIRLTSYTLKLYIFQAPHERPLMRSILQLTVEALLQIKTLNIIVSPADSPSYCKYICVLDWMNVR